MLTLVRRLASMRPLLVLLVATSCTHHAGVLRRYQQVTLVPDTGQPTADAPIRLAVTPDEASVAATGMLQGKATASRAGTAEYEIASRVVDAVDPYTMGEAIGLRLIALPFYLGFVAPLWSNEVADYGGDGAIGAGDRLLDLVHTINPLMAWPGLPHEAGDDTVVASRRERRTADLDAAVDLELVLRSHRGEVVCAVPVTADGSFRLDLLPLFERVWDDDLVGVLRLRGASDGSPLRNLAANARQHLAAVGRLEPLQWQIACEQDSRPAYARFVAMHPGAGYAADVAARLDDLAWREARTADDRAAYVAFVQKYPGHRCTADARARIDELDWQGAGNGDSVAACERYLALQPEGAHAEAAHRRMAQLQLARDWQLAERRATPAAYHAFADAHPDAAEAKVAQQRSADLERHAAAWLATCSAGTAAAFTAYKAANPESPYATAADRALQDLAGRDIADLLDEGKIEVRTGGQSIQNVGVEARRLVPYPIRVLVPAGTFFACARESAQNMVATDPTSLVLPDDEWAYVLVAAACANRPRDIPGEADTFTVQRRAHGSELERLMALPAAVHADYATIQAAIWILTDDASYADLGHLVSRPAGTVFGGTRVIGATETALAIRLCADAGIDVGRKRILGDRDDVVAALPDGELKTWLATRSPAPIKR